MKHETLYLAPEDGEARRTRRVAIDVVSTGPRTQECKGRLSRRRLRSLNGMILLHTRQPARFAFPKQISPAIVHSRPRRQLADDPGNIYFTL